MKDRSHDETVAEVFRCDPGYAVELLNSTLEDGDQGGLLIALRQVVDTFSGARSMAKPIELNSFQLYRTLSGKGNPEVRSLTVVPRAIGLHSAIQSLYPATASH